MKNMKVSDYLSVLKGIVFELETIRVNINDEDKVLRLVWYISTSYEHNKYVLICGT